MYHSFISGVADGADTAVVRPVDWNADHVDKNIKYVQLTVFAPDADCTTGDGKAFLYIPPIVNGYYLSSVFGAHAVAGTSDGPFEAQLWNMADSLDMLVQPISIELGELYTSDATTSLTISSDADSLATGDIIRVDIDTLTLGVAPKGFILSLGFTPNAATTD